MESGFAGGPTHLSGRVKSSPAAHGMQGGSRPCWPQIYRSPVARRDRSLLGCLNTGSVAGQETCSRAWWSLAGLSLVWVAMLKTPVRACGFTLFFSREGFDRGFSCSLLYRGSVSPYVWWGSPGGSPCLCSLPTALSSAAGHSTPGPLSQPLNLPKN